MYINLVVLIHGQLKTRQSTCSTLKKQNTSISRCKEILMKIVKNIDIGRQLGINWLKGNGVIHVA